MSKLLEYLNHLDQNAEARDAHLDDPSAAMRNHGLSDEEHDAVINGDTKKVSELIGVPEASLRSIQSIIGLP